MASFDLFSSSFTPGYINFSVPDAMLIAFFVYLIFRFTAYRKKGSKKKKYLGYLFVYVGALAALTLFPIRSFSSLNSMIGGLWYNLTNVQIIPFASIRTMVSNAMAAGQYTLMLYNLAGNLLMLMPLGYIYPKLQGSARTGRVFTTALLTSGLIEAYQYVGGILGFCHRDVNIDDIILNVVGCVIFYWICKLFKWVK